jgi:DNA-directed RNA polymerase specialized sigma24 family protein
MADMERVPDEPVTFIEKMMSIQGDIPMDDTNWEMIELVAETLQTLETEHKLLLDMRFYHRYPYSKITALMGYSSKSVAWYNVQRALDQLRAALVANKEIIERYI